MQSKSSSPFNMTEFQPIEDIYTKPSKLFGLQDASGRILINFDHNTKYSMLLQIARITGCEVVLVAGTWTFTPDTVSETDGEDDEVRSE